MRNKFDEQLHRLDEQLTHMGELCEAAIAKATDALKHGSIEEAKAVISEDEEIDQCEKDIERLCLKLLLQQQPVAKDLRRISAALKMITDMERIGDQARDIAEMLGYVVQHPFESRLHIGDMARASIKMVTDSVDSFVRKDYDAALAVIQEDDVVDDLFEQVKKELIGAIASQPEEGEVLLDMLMIAKYFERIGDHATNIAEWVCYSLTGEHV